MLIVRRVRRSSNLKVKTMSALRFSSPLNDTGYVEDSQQYRSRSLIQKLLAGPSSSVTRIQPRKRQPKSHSQQLVSNTKQRPVGAVRTPEAHNICFWYVSASSCPSKSWFKERFHHKWGSNEREREEGGLLTILPSSLLRNRSSCASSACIVTLWEWEFGKKGEEFLISNVSLASDSIALGCPRTFYLLLTTSALR